MTDFSTFKLLLLSTALKMLPIEGGMMNNISQKPIFSNAFKWNCLDSKEICEIVTPLIKSHLKESNYDRMFITSQYIDHHITLSKANPSICPLQTLETFVPDLSLGELKGSSCFGLNLDLLTRLPSDLSAYPIPATLLDPQQSYWPTYSHVALVIPFYNLLNPNDSGYILLDPHLKMETPTVLTFSGKPEIKDLKEKGVFSFFYKKGKIFSQKVGSPNEEDFYAIYSLTHFINPAEASLKPILATDRNITLYSRNEKGEVIASLIVMLDKNLLRISLAGNIPRTIFFSDFLSQKEQLEDAFAEGLHIEKGKLYALVEKIVLHKNLLDDLYHKYIDLINKN